MSPVAVKCPTCGRQLEWATATFRPFCSERCRLVDLGAWFSGQRAIPGEEAATSGSEDSPPSEPKDPQA